MPEETTTITIRLPVKMKRRLEILAKEQDRSRSWLVVHAIRHFLQEQEKKPRPRPAELGEGIDREMPLPAGTAEGYDADP